MVKNGRLDSCPLLWGSRWRRRRGKRKKYTPTPKGLRFARVVGFALHVHSEYRRWKQPGKTSWMVLLYPSAASSMRNCAMRSFYLYSSSWASLKPLLSNVDPRYMIVRRRSSLFSESCGESKTDVSNLVVLTQRRLEGRNYRRSGCLCYKILSQLHHLRSLQ